jgi:hypothetical protein
VTAQPKTWDCEPTLTDSQVVDFCRNGYLLLEGVVPDDVNVRALAYLEEEDPGREPSGILQQDWFVENVMCNPVAAGAVRCLLGRDFGLPILMSNHRVQNPNPATGGWHVDGNYRFDHELRDLQVFYYPQDTPLEDGPTQVVPGTHLIPNKARFMGHLDGIRGAVSTASPAGSIFITAYQIWHRRGPATSSSLRNMLKYCYWRTTAPTRDWIVEPDFDFATVNYGGPANQFVEQFRGDLKCARLFLWLCGMGDAYRNVGGQSWPLPANRLDVAYGFPEKLPRKV